MEQPSLHHVPDSIQLQLTAMSVPACQPLPHLGQGEVAGLQELHQVQDDLPGGSVGPGRELEPGGVTAGGQGLQLLLQPLADPGPDRGE